MIRSSIVYWLYLLATVIAGEDYRVRCQSRQEDIDLFGSSYPCLTLLGCKDKDEEPLLDFCLRDPQDENYRADIRQCFSERRNTCKFRCTDSHYDSVNRCSLCSEFRDDSINQTFIASGEIHWTRDVVREIFIYNKGFDSSYLQSNIPMNRAQLMKYNYRSLIDRELFDRTFSKYKLFPGI